MAKKQLLLSSCARRAGLYWLLLGSTAWTVACGGSEAAPAPPPAPPVEKVVQVRSLRLTPEDVTDRLSVAADLMPLRRAVLAAEVAGTVEAVNANEGDAVAAGRVLVTVDTRALTQALAEAEAVFRQAQAQLERAQALFDKRSVTKKDLLDALTARDVAQARLASVKLELAKSRLAAPWSGRIAAKRVEVGDFVAPGQGLFELVAVDRLKVRAAVAAADVPFLQVGAPAQVRVTGFDEVFTARVARLGAELDPAARTLQVEAEIQNSDGRLRPGMLAQLEIPRRRYPGALVVPLAAVADLEQGKAVYVVVGELATRKVVTLGPVLGDRVVITSGLAVGDRVIVEGQDQVSGGQKVSERGAA